LIKNRQSSKDYFFSKKTLWYWITVALAILTVITVLTVSKSDIPLVYLRSILGIFFFLFLPGFAIVKNFYSTERAIRLVPQKTLTIEYLALSFGISLVVVPIVGLILSFTPWGFRLIPLVLSLFIIIIIFATLAIIRQIQNNTS